MEEEIPNEKNEEGHHHCNPYGNRALRGHHIRHCVYFYDIRKWRQRIKLDDE